VAPPPAKFGLELPPLGRVLMPLPGRLGDGKLPSEERFD
jgi:hypothetical protein